ncbi:hypothetical protein [Xanthomonas citri]|uniref:hypothetical protein n=1 Tax=Xanthomonas citri TaxID=346 RepID=UPI0011831E9E|nr:hypothetical protein [Xanthomonas citri]QTK40640.1 hypothetical protein XcgCFBP7119R_08305 [Xanthomonas citri pv. glycines]
MSDLPEVPRAAFSNFEQREISDDWIAAAEPEEQVAAMVEWFNARYEDPTHATPYMGSEGGYIWVQGGPYDASEEIQERFGHVVPDEVMQHAADYLVGEDGVWEWAPTQLTYYREEQDLFVEDKNVPLNKLRERLDGLLAVLRLQGEARAVEMARNLAYAGVISALETFLWETMAYWVDHDEQTVRNLIKEHSLFKDRKIPLGSIFEVYESVGIQVKSHMQRMTWHRWDEAKSLIEHGLGVESPSFIPFEAPTQKRHDIVHRLGHNVDGIPINITVEEVQSLAGEVQRFAAELHQLIDHAKTPSDERFEDGS